MQQTVSVSSLMKESGVTFGTSGARGLVKDMTDMVCYTYTIAFLQHLEAQGVLESGTPIGIGGDLRVSTFRIMSAVARAVIDGGNYPVNCGRIPSPALAYYGMQKGIPTIMVTGSHIPDDRNGIKFNKADGEILKADEEGMCVQTVTLPPEYFEDEGSFVKPSNDLPQEDQEASDIYVQRYLDFFPAACLHKMKIGLYEHSGVGRDVLYEILTKLGAEVIRLGRSDAFIPVDTEAIRSEDTKLALTWAKEYNLDAIVSTDGDADRPLVGTEQGVWLRGDIAGVLCATYLDIKHIVTPVSCNTGVERCGLFESVYRTRIGSPFVIERMQQSIAEKDGAVAGYEANGGFLLGTPVKSDGKTLAPLPTRDAIIVILSLLVDAHGHGKKLSVLASKLPARFTASDRLKEFPTDQSQACIARFVGVDEASSYKAIEAVFGELCGEVENIDVTDGLRIIFQNGEVIHLRPSGNAPEFRCYNEANSLSRSESLNQSCMKIIDNWRI